MTDRCQCECTPSRETLSLDVLAARLAVHRAGKAQIAELEAELAKGGGGAKSKAAVDALRVALAAGDRNAG